MARYSPNLARSKGRLVGIRVLLVNLGSMCESMLARHLLQRYHSAFDAIFLDTTLATLPKGLYISITDR